MNDLQERLTRAGNDVDIDVERELDDFHRSVHRRNRGRRVATIAVAATIAAVGGVVAWQLFPVGGATTSVGGTTGLSGRIAYTVVTVTADHQDGDVAIVDAGTGTVTPEGTGGHDDVLPVWSPDGTQVAFLSDEGSTEGSYQLFAMNADGSDRRLLAAGSFSSAAWSPDGTSLAAVAGDGGISIVSVNGMGESASAGEAIHGNWDHVAWSPDGTRLLVSGFPKTDANTGLPDLYTMTPDGRDLVQLTHDEQNEQYAGWSPDGTRIVYMRNTTADDFDPKADIWVMDADGSDPVRLTDWPGFDGEPVWSPDGRWIAFGSDRDATPEQQQAVADGDVGLGISVFAMDPQGGHVRLLVDAGDTGLFASSWIE
jgi:Tol biopolymer transport system component